MIRFPVPALSFALTPALAAILLVGTSAAAPLEAPSERPALWLVEDEDTRIHLFGTMHLLPEDADWLDADLRAALSDSSELWLEIADLTDTGSAQVLMAEHGFSDTPLSTRLPEETLARLEAAADTVGIDMAAFEGMEPWLAGLQLSAASALAASEAEFDFAADLVLREEALAAGLAIEGLETMEEQILFFVDLSEEAQIGFLESGIEEIEEGTGFILEFTEAWLGGDEALLEAMTFTESETEGELYEALFVARNAAWADRIEEMLARPGTFFIAVGTGHLIGEDSVQNMLAERGVAVSRVR